MTKYLDLINGTDDLNLLTGTIRASDDWRPAIDLSPNQIDETIPIYVEGTEATIITATKLFEKIIRAGQRYNNDQIERQPTILRWKPDSRTNSQQSVITNGSITWQNKGKIENGVLAPKRLYGTMNLTRLNQWEEVSATTVINSVAIGNLGDTISITSHDSPIDSRISELELTTTDITGYQNVWLGIRRKREGLTYFKTLWEIEDGTNWDTDTADEVLAGASGGDCVKTSFATVATHILRWKLTLEAGGVNTSNSHHMTGRYLALMRTQLTTTGTVGIQLKTGYFNTADDNLTPHPEVYITNTDWRMVPIGVVQMPPHAVTVNLTNQLKRFTFAMWAERLSGSAQLRCDCIVLIPTDHLAIIQNTELNSTQDLHLYTRMIGEPYAILLTSTASYDSSAEASFENWFVPNGDSVLVCAAEGEFGHDLAGDDITVLLYAMKRSAIYTP